VSEGGLPPITPAAYPPGPFEWAAAARTLAGEDESGDLAFFAARRDGVLAAVVDGLGHGDEAAVAARLAVETIEAHAEDDLAELIRRCHDALRRTRGAVVALVVARDGGTINWTGVGNVEAVVVRGAASGRTKREHALLLGGVIGMQIPNVRPSTTTLSPGDEIILATDGIRQSFIDDLVVGPPQRTADDILQRYASGRDDALVLVGRYRGGAS
jgi:phosphoserine phosphatase RsbX